MELRKLLRQRPRFLCREQRRKISGFYHLRSTLKPAPVAAVERPNQSRRQFWLLAAGFQLLPKASIEIRADFDRSFGEKLEAGRQKPELPAGLGRGVNGSNRGRLQGGAKGIKTAEVPPLLGTEESS